MDISLEKVIEYQICESGSLGCCNTLIPPAYVPPNDSSCWLWWDPPVDGVMKTGLLPPKSCDYEPCQDAVCACDSYCCETAWDLSCRGYEGAQGDSTGNNYFVDDCFVVNPKLEFQNHQLVVPSHLFSPFLLIQVSR